LEYFFICSDNPKKWTLNEMRQTGPNYSTVWCAEWDFEAGAVVTELRNAYSYRKQLDSNSIVSKLPLPPSEKRFQPFYLPAMIWQILWVSWMI
jgi:hypothetical protein